MPGDACESGTCTKKEDLWLGLASLALLGVAAVYAKSATDGEASAQRCVELRCAFGVEAACRRLLPPPPPPEPSAPWEGATDSPPQGVPGAPPDATVAPSPADSGAPPPAAAATPAPSTRALTSRPVGP